MKMYLKIFALTVSFSVPLLQAEAARPSTERGKLNDTLKQPLQGIEQGLKRREALHSMFGLAEEQRSRQSANEPWLKQKNTQLSGFLVRISEGEVLIRVPYPQETLQQLQRMGYRRVFEANQIAHQTIFGADVYLLFDRIGATSVGEHRFHEGSEIRLLLRRDHKGSPVVIHVEEKS